MHEHMASMPFDRPNLLLRASPVYSRNFIPPFHVSLISAPVDVFIVRQPHPRLEHETLRFARGGMVTPTDPLPSLLWPLLFYAAAAAVLIAGMVGVSFLLGQRHSDRATGSPYESGIVPGGPAHIRISVKYYMIAMVFVLFDLAAAFVFLWAVSLKATGWPGYIGIIGSIAVLAAGFVYLWREGALDWGGEKRGCGPHLTPGPSPSQERGESQSALFPSPD
jgi:NADH-quinone oxidoreductase subunit A